MPIQRRAFEELVASTSAALILYARQWTDSPEDVVQEAFLKLLAEPELPGNANAWLYRVTRHLAINALRSQVRRLHHERMAADDRSPWFVVDPANALDAQQASAALAELSADDRETVVARLWGGLTFDEIAELTSASTSTVYRRYQRGIQQLRNTLAPQFPGVTNDESISR